VGYQCVGGFKRQVKEEKLILNRSQGRSLSVEVPAEVVEMAEKAARTLKVEVAGTDLVKDSQSGKVYVIEVNEAPQFKVFEKRTKINAAGKILEYCVEKFSK
jgi:glutathione synthase/RimK-type ligase-like ATP-grasp enzyme